MMKTPSGGLVVLWELFSLLRVQGVKEFRVLGFRDKGGDQDRRSGA